MQTVTIMIGGLEHVFMQKLAVYLKDRFGERARIGVSDQAAFTNLNSEHRPLILLGGEDWIRQHDAMADQSIRLTEEQDDDSEEIFQYQSREILYQAICERCRCYLEVSGPERNHSGQIWDVFLGDAASWKLDIYSNVWAGLRGRDESVLNIALSECSVTELLFEMEHMRSLDDLILDLRRGAAGCIEEYVMEMEYYDRIPALSNPMILHELDEKDIAGLMEYLERQSKYKRIVITMGNTCCGSQSILCRADDIYEITDSMKVHSIIAAPWKRFIETCRKSQGTSMIQIPAEEITVDTTGRHLLSQWCDGFVGKNMLEHIAGQMHEKEGADYGRNVAGDTPADQYRTGSQQRYF